MIGIFITAGLIVICILSIYLTALYFFRRTMVRKFISQESTLDMAETNWDKHIPRIMEAKKWTDEYPRKLVSIKSDDGLLLNGALFEAKDNEKLAICFHGYTSEGQNDYIIQTRFFLENNFNVMLVDQRAHGKSEGKYVGFGVLDSLDAKKWIDYSISRFGKDVKILLYGTSMGGATTLMTLGRGVPENVRAAISDCAFSSAYNVFSHVLKSQYHIPVHPMMDIANKMAIKKAGYSLKELDARELVKSCELPVLFILILNLQMPY